MDEVDRCIAVVKPDSWKGYTVGDPLLPSKAGSYWRLDDEKIMYPFYEKIVKNGTPTVCIHKGLLPADYEKSWPNVWQYTTVWDVGQAAKDWPQINFVIYHAALRPFLETPDAALAEFEQTGRIKWATDLAEIPAKYGVKNVYGEIGTAFASCAVANPRFAAAFLGTLVRGLGADHVVYGSDSVWYGSPQWQIEALRRIEIPEDMQKKHGFAPLGAGRRHRQERDLLGQLRPALQGPHPGGAGGDHHGQDRRDQGRVRRHGRDAEQYPLRIRASGYRVRWGPSRRSDARAAGDRLGVGELTDAEARRHRKVRRADGNPPDIYQLSA